MGYGSSPEGGCGIGVSTDHVDAYHAGRLDIADAELLFRGHFARSGPDLVLTGQDGHRLVVTGYFTTEKHPDLVAPNGAHLTGDLVDLLAGSPTPGQYAQARSTLPPDAIGKVEKAVGQVTLIHNGVAGPLHVGDPVYKADIVQTGANSSAGIAFPDGTALDLVNDTRMALNEFNYEPNSAANGALFSLVEGTFAFVAGQVAHTGEGMKIKTPIATMGIRGTVGLFRSEPTVINSNLGHVWSAFLHEDIDGSHHLGRIALVDQDPTSPTFGQVFYLLDSSDYIAYLEPQGTGQPPHVRLEPITNSQALQDRHFFDDLGKIIDSYNKANSQSPANPGSGDDPSDLFQQQLLQEDGGKPLFNFGKLNGSGDPYDPPSSSPLIPVMGGLIPNTSPTPNGPTTNIFIWTGGTGPWTLGPNWTPGSSPGSPGDIVEVPTGTVIYNNNFTIGTLIVGPNGTLDIVGGSLTVVNGASNGGTITVEGDPPALTINGLVTVGNIGSFTATGSGDEIQFANGTVDNHGAVSAVKQGTVSFVNEGITNEPDGKILARGKGSEIEFAGAILINLGIVVATHHGIVQLSDVMLQNGGLIAADDGGKLWITDLQHGSANYGLVEAIDGGKITIVSDNDNASGGSGSGHGGNFGNLEAIGRGSIVDIENKNGDSFDNQGGGTVAALDGGKILFSGDVNNHSGGAIDAQSGGLITFDTGKVTNEHCSTIEASACGSEIDLSCTTVWNDGVIAAKHGGIVDIANSTITQGSDGVIAAIGHDSLVNLEGAAIVGGSLETSCGGVIQTACGDSLLDNVTITCDSQILVNDGTSLALEGRIDNRGTIWLGESPSQGGGDNQNFALVHSETDLVIDHCVTLTGQGSIVLAGDDDKVVGADCGGSLYNVNDTISGAGAIGEGSGDLKLVNGSCGVIDANSHGQTLMIDTGNAITNLGILEVTNGGLLQLQDAVNDCGSGHALIKDGTIEFDAAANVDVTFDNCTGYGKLVLGDAKDFAGTISGFGGTDVNNTDEIDLKGIATNEVTFSEDDAGDAVIAICGTNQVLTKITLDNFDYQNLEKASDGHGGTIIYDPPATSSAGPSVSIGGTGNDTFVFHPGEGAQTVNDFNPQHDTIDLDHFASIHDAQELAAAITPDVHGNALLELGHGDSIAIPGVSATFLQQNLQSLVHLHT